MKEPRNSRAENCRKQFKNKNPTGPENNMQKEKNILKFLTSIIKHNVEERSGTEKTQTIKTTTARHLTNN